MILMLYNKCNMTYALAILVVTLMFGSSSCFCVSALPLQVVIDHHKLFTKKQGIGSSPNGVPNAVSDNGNGGRFSRGSDRTFGHMHDSSSTGDGITDSSSVIKMSSHNPNNLGNSGDNNDNQGTNDASNTNPENNLQTTEPADSSNHNHSTSADITTAKDDTPFVLSLPFP
jgi:hypothetical protein